MLGAIGWEQNLNKNIGFTIEFRNLLDKIYDDYADEYDFQYDFSNDYIDWANQFVRWLKNKGCETKHLRNLNENELQTITIYFNQYNVRIV